MSGRVERLRPIEGRVPPHDLDAEGAVLSAALLSSDAFDTIQNIVASEHFYSDANRRVFEALVKVRAEGQRIDGVTVAAKLKSTQRLDQIGGTQYLARLTNATPSVAHVEDHANIVRKKSRLRRVIDVCQKHAALGYGDINDVDAFEDTLEHKLFQIRSTKSESTNATMQVVVEEALEEVRLATAQKGIVGVRTGFRPWDRTIGGMRGGEVHVIAARPGMGKTALLLALSVNAATTTDDRPGVGVQIFSLEMLKRHLGLRMLSAEAEVDLHALRRGELTDDEWDRIDSAAKVLRELPISIDDMSSQTIMEMRSTARRRDAALQREGKKLGLIVVDYVQLAEASGNESNREQEVASLVRGMKGIANDFDVPVLVISQLNRALESRPDRRPQLSDLRESGAIEQDADVVGFIYRDEYYTKAECKTPGRAELIFGKHRNGPTVTIELGFDAEFATFYDLPEKKESEAEFGEDLQTSF